MKFEMESDSNKAGYIHARHVYEATVIILNNHIINNKYILYLHYPD